MMLGAHPLGCSIKCLHSMSSKHFHGQAMGDKGFDPYTKAGLDQLITRLGKSSGLGLDRSGLCIWSDTSESDEGEWIGKEDKSGKKFYDYLKKLGHHVEKSKPYKNPEHEGMCTLYMWYFRRKPEPRPTRSATSIGRKEVVSKAKTTKRAPASRKVRFG